MKLSHRKYVFPEHSGVKRCTPHVRCPHGISWRYRENRVRPLTGIETVQRTLLFSPSILIAPVPDTHRAQWNSQTEGSRSRANASGFHFASGASEAGFARSPSPPEPDTRTFEREEPAAGANESRAGSFYYDTKSPYFITVTCKYRKETETFCRFHIVTRSL